MREIKTEADCRLLYVEILNGYSQEVGGKFFFKHPTELEYCQAELVRQRFLIEGEKIGLVSEKEKLNLLEQKGIWTKENETAFQDATVELESLRISSKGLVIPQQVADITRRIKEHESMMREKFSERSELVGITKEVFASRRASEYQILRAFYKDIGCSIPAFTEKEADELSPEELIIFIDIYERTAKDFTDRNIKCVAACPFFLMPFIASDGNVMVFFGKPVIQLTIYQLALYNRARHFQRLLEQDIQPCPDEYYSDLDKVIKYYDQQYSILQGKRKNKQVG